MLMAFQDNNTCNKKWRRILINLSGNLRHNYVEGRPRDDSLLIYSNGPLASLPSTCSVITGKVYSVVTNSVSKCRKDLTEGVGYLTESQQNVGYPILGVEY